MGGVKRKRNVLNVKPKLEILQKLDNGESASTGAEVVLNEGNTISHSATLQPVETLLDYMGRRGFDYGDITEANGGRVTRHLLTWAKLRWTNETVNSLSFGSEEVGADESDSSSAYLGKSNGERVRLVICLRGEVTVTSETRHLLHLGERSYGGTSSTLSSAYFGEVTVWTSETCHLLTWAK
ncbi:hypothetical protein AVEN_264675-1 [Araneus ventricosus]|uniref:Uncharacterized protein n=1 Tax=Araneus ventricosus TaxID=182803 RepID=A0A4Y2JLA5_ARAVE|nr:hypothetical protein AVEN_264675-1 [Araneus ventricosus]